MLEIRDMTYRVGTRSLFEHANMTLTAGEKVGLIGLNGTGKTTLFKLILKDLEPDLGSVEKATKNIRMTTVKQEIPDKNKPLVDFVLEADTDRSTLMKRLNETKDPNELAEIHDLLITIGAAAAPSRAATILSGLGFKQEDMDKPLKTFSGGWQMRAALAATLFAPADLLLLDEPTNHLDFEATVWLEDYLTKWPGTLLLISHDVHILNKLCRRIVEISQLQLKSYGGNYDVYEKTKEIQAKVTERSAVKFEQRRAHMQAFVDRFRYKATKAKQAQSRLKMLEKMGDAPELVRDPSVHFDFPSPEELTSPLLYLEHVKAGYGEKVVLSDLDLRFDADDRIALLGENGNGKTTLAKVIAGRLKPMEGSLVASNKLRIAYFAQDQAEEFDGTKTPYRIMQDELPGEKEAKIRAHLGRFGLMGDKALTPVENLSGGEKARLLLAKITKDAPHILILDEPTNHLDILSRKALIEALNTYGGTVILITHDFMTIEQTCDQLWLVKNGTCKTFNGDLDDFKNSVLREKNKEAKEEKIKKKSNKELREEAVKERAAEAAIKRKEENLLKKVARLEEEKKMLEQALSKEYTEETQAKYTEVQNELEILESEFLNLKS